MNAWLYDGVLRHTRSREAAHDFVYRLHLYALDVDQLDRLERECRWFGHNRLRPFALHDRDYLYPGPAPLRDKVIRALRENGIERPPSEIVLVTALRQFHYVFNPVSFFFCRDAHDYLFAVLAQVNNTFGETHLYVLEPEDDAYSFVCDKVFHVSPFFPRTGRYRFRLIPPGQEQMTIEINYLLDDQPALLASFTGTATPLNAAIFARTLFLHPLRTAMTFPRILVQAARLSLSKRLKVYPKPEPCSPLTIRPVPPNWLDRLAERVIISFFRQLDQGRMSLVMPEGTTVALGPASVLPHVRIMVHRRRFFTRAMLAADIGFGESFEDGDWSSPELVELLALLSLREEVVNDRRLWPALAGRALNFLFHLRRDNSLAGSRRNIRAHYDLGNEFYRLFLDPTMAYSSGLFFSAGDSLEEAQRNKFATIIAKAGIGSEDHVLEVGCGWGGFALEAVRRTGCRLVGITVSREQFEWATRRVREEGLADQIEIQLCDYRHVQGQFSKIVSIEMIEAVGHRHLPGFFAALDRLLVPGGRVVLQAIAMVDQKYQAYRLSSDWIRKHIFPGGHLPSLSAMIAAMSKASRFNVVALEDIGSHYVRTLELWRQTLLDQRQQVFALGFDESFLRRWDYYFSYCEAGFRNQLVRNYHLVLARMGEPVEGEQS